MFLKSFFAVLAVLALVTVTNAATCANTQAVTETLSMSCVSTFSIQSTADISLQLADFKVSTDFCAVGKSNYIANLTVGHNTLCSQAYTIEEVGSNATLTVTLTGCGDQESAANNVYSPTRFLTLLCSLMLGLFLHNRSGTLALLLISGLISAMVVQAAAPDCFDISGTIQLPSTVTTIIVNDQCYGDCSASSNVGGLLSQYIFPQSMNLIPAKQESSSRKRTDYTDAQQYAENLGFRVYNEAADPLSSVSNILCIVGNLGFLIYYTDSNGEQQFRFLDQGPFTSSVDQSMCESGNSQDVRIMLWTVNMTNMTDHVRVEFMSQFGQNEYLRASAQIYPDAPATKLYGNFRLLWSFYNTTTTTTPYSWGTIETIENEDLPNGSNASIPDALTAIVFSEYSDDRGRSENCGEGQQGTRGINVKSAAAIYTKVNDQINGVGKTARSKTDAGGCNEGTASWGLHVGENYLSVTDQADTTKCFDRNDYKTAVWNYKLFDATSGDAFDFSAGFPYTDENGNYGFVSYWGAWSQTGSNSYPLNVTGAGARNGEWFQLRQGAGKLEFQESVEAPVTEVGGTTFNEYVWGSTPTVTLADDSTTSNYQFRVWRYNANNNDWEYFAVGSESYGNCGRTSTVSNLKTPVTRPGNQCWLNFYKDGFGNVEWDCNNPTKIRFRAVTQVTPSLLENVNITGNNITLYCLSRCPQPVINASDLAGNGFKGDLYFPEPEQLNETIVYHLIVDEWALYYGDEIVRVNCNIQGGCDSNGNGGSQYNNDVGTLVSEDMLAELTDIYSRPENFLNYYYGLEEYNKQILVKNAADEWVNFDQPLSFTYVHTTANDIDGSSDYNGAYLLRFDGQGLGLPYVEVEADGETRCYPLFGLATGTEITIEGNDYNIVAFEGEQRLVRVANSLCTNANLDSSAATLNTRIPFNAPNPADIPRPTNHLQPIFTQQQFDSYPACAIDGVWVNTTNCRGAQPQ